MVDLAGRPPSRREATARSEILLPPEVLSLRRGEDLLGPKGPVFATAVVAGTLAVKRTSDLIPFCHPLSLEKIRFSFSIVADRAIIECTVACQGSTGVEMEALTGASVAALTVYDMCKALSLEIEIVSTRLLAKSGGRRNLVRQD